MARNSYCNSCTNIGSKGNSRSYTGTRGNTNAKTCGNNAYHGKAKVNAYTYTYAYTKARRIQSDIRNSDACDCVFVFLW
jgi:hypothetical protein